MFTSAALSGWTNLVVARFHLFLTGSHLAVSASTMWVTWTRGLAMMLDRWIVPALPRPKMANLTVEGANPELHDKFSSYWRYLKSQ